MTQYSEIKVLPPTGSEGIEIKTLNEAASFLESLELSIEEPDAATDQYLFKKSQELNDLPSLQCLRCRVSHPIVEFIKNECNRWSKEYGYRFEELITYVLHDSGKEKTIKLPSGSDVDFKFSELSLIEKTINNPFSAEILKTYEPTNKYCSLSSWTKTKLRCNNELKEYAKAHGRIVKTDWCLLMNTSQKKVRESINLCGPSNSTLEYWMALHRSYCKFYPDRKKYNWKNNTYDPSIEFCDVVNSQDDYYMTLDKLKKLAKSIRIYEAYLLGNPLSAQQSTEIELKSEVEYLSELESEDEKKLFINQWNLISSMTQEEMKKHMSIVLSNLSSEPSNNLLNCLWIQWAKGLSQRNIAEKCREICKLKELTQGKVSKNLKISSHQTDIAISVAKRLLRDPLFSDFSSSVQKIEKLVSAIKSYLLKPIKDLEEVEDPVMAPMRLCVIDLLETS